MIKSSSLASSVAFKPSTSFEYSDCNFSASVDFISSIFLSRFLAPLEAFRNESSVKSMLKKTLAYNLNVGSNLSHLRDSIATLSML